MPDENTSSDRIAEAPEREGEGEKGEATRSRS
jgi:hypothetical protein